MATKNAHVTWDPVSGSTGYLFEYRLTGDTAWITPTVPPNPTLNTSYDIVVDVDTYYDIKITSYGTNCAARSITSSIFVASGQCCPAGYVLSVDGSYCEQTNVAAATPPSAGENTVAAPYITYSEWGTLVYAQGYNVNGVGAFTQIPFTNPFWVNGPGYPNEPGNAVDGPMNRSALWATTTADNQIIGFTVCITVTEGKWYYVGMGGDNLPFIKLDGNLVIEMDYNAMANYLATHGYPQILIFPNAASEATFNWWHIYPVFIPAGTHVLELSCTNTTLVAAMAAEIYDATLSELIAATSYVDLGAKLIWSSKDYIGQPVQIGTGGIGYECPDGYSLVLCDGPAYCKQVLTSPTIDCANVDLIYWGSNFTGVPPIEAVILVSNSMVADGSIDVPIDWTLFNASPSYLWVAIPNLGPLYDKNQWFVDLINEGAIGGISNLFGDATHVTVLGVDYFVWITNYETQFLNICQMQKR